MAVYLLHISPPLRHAKHYVGFTPGDVADRFAQHIAGQGSKLVRAAVQAGRRVEIAAVWPTGCRGFERWLKRRKDAPSYCPHCFTEAKRRPLPTVESFEASPFRRMRCD